MSRHGFAHRLALHAKAAETAEPSLADKRVHPHVLRHYLLNFFMSSKL